MTSFLPREAAPPHGEDATAYRTLDIVATSAAGIQDAIEGALQRAARALPHVEWFEVTDLRGTVTDGRVGRWQVGLRMGYRLEEAPRNRDGAGPVAEA